MITNLARKEEQLGGDCFPRGHCCRGEGGTDQSYCTKGQNTKKIHRLQNAKIRCRLQAGSQVFVLTPATNSSLPDTLFTSIWPDIVLTKSVNSILY